MQAGILTSWASGFLRWRALGDVGQRDHGPEHGPAEVGYQLHVNGIGHVVQAGNDQRSVNKAENCAENHLERAGDTRIDHGGDSGTNAPADGTENKVGRNDRQQQAAEGDDNHRHHLRRNPAEKFFQVNQGKRRQNGGNHLGLIADHVDLEEAEVPEGDGLCGGHAVGVEELSGNQGQAQHDAQHLRGPHFLGHRPADAHRQHVEHRLANQPEEAVQTGPELTEAAESFCSVLK